MKTLQVKFNGMKKKFKIVLAWMLIYLYPIAVVGYLIVAFGIGLKITGYILKFNFDSAWSELQDINEDFRL